MWELIFLMVILKIPIVYLCLVVYWAVKAEPKPDDPEPALVAVTNRPTPPSSPRRHGWPRPHRPHGSPARRYARSGRVAAVHGRR